MTAFVLRSSLGCGGEVLTASRTAVQLYSCAGGFGAGTQISALCCPPPPPLPPSPPAPQSPFPQAPATPRPPRQPRSPRPPPNTPPVAPPSPPAPPPPLGLGSLVPDPGGQQPPTPSQGIRDQQEQGDVSPAPGAHGRCHTAPKQPTCVRKLHHKKYSTAVADGVHVAPNAFRTSVLAMLHLSSPPCCTFAVCRSRRGHGRWRRRQPHPRGAHRRGVCGTHRGAGRSSSRPVRVEQEVGARTASGDSWCAWRPFPVQPGSHGLPYPVRNLALTHVSWARPT